MSKVRDHATFVKAYEGDVPWDVGEPHGVFTQVAERVISPVLDAGCGLGDKALHLAAMGHRVTGIDFVEEAIRRARAKAAERGLKVDFLVKDALTLGDWDQQFASVVDSGLFHVFPVQDRVRYVQGLAHVLEPGGRVFLMCGSDAEPREVIPKVSQQELYEAFADGWDVESLARVVYPINPSYRFPDGTTAEGGAKGWFVVLRKV